MSGALRPRLVGALCGALACAAAAAHAEPFETPRPLVASELLGAKAVRGEHYRIEPAVENDGLMNRYVVASSYQRIGADGDSLALERAREQEAMAALRQIKTTDAYKQGLAAAAQAPLALTKQALTDPVAVMKSAPEALGNFVGDVSGALGGLGRGVGSGGSSSDSLKQLIGYQRVKRRLAFETGVDPFSSNDVLQTDLDDVAWAIFAGGASVELAMTQAPMAASLSMTAAKHLHGAHSPLWNVPMPTLLKASADAFESAGIGEDEAADLAWHPACTLSHQTLLSSTVSQLAGVAGRDAFLRQALAARDEADCRRYVETARLLWTYHRERRPLARLELKDGVLIAVDADGRSLLPLRADYVFWTPAAGELVAALPGSGERAVWLSGAASPATRRALAEQGIALHERVFTRHPGQIDVAGALVPQRSEEAPPEDANANASGGKGGLLGGFGSGLFGAGDDQGEAP